MGRWIHSINEELRLESATSEPTTIEKDHMAKSTGEKSFNASDRTVKKFNNTPLTPTKYEGKLLPGLELKKAAGAGKLPYIFGMVEILNTGKDGGKNRKMTKMFFLNTSPDADGIAGVDRGDGIVAYSKAVGANLKCGVIEAMKEVKGSTTGELTKVWILDPNAALKYLEGTAGTIHSFQTKNEAAQDGTKWPKVDFYIEAEEESGDEEDEDEDDESDDEDDEDEEDVDEDDEEADEDDDEDEDEEGDEEDAPAPKSKVKQGPLSKGKRGKK